MTSVVERAVAAEIERDLLALAVETGALAAPGSDEGTLPTTDERIRYQPTSGALVFADAMDASRAVQVEAAERAVIQYALALRHDPGALEDLHAAVDRLVAARAGVQP